MQKLPIGYYFGAMVVSAPWIIKKHGLTNARFSGVLQQLQQQLLQVSPHFASIEFSLDFSNHAWLLSSPSSSGNTGLEASTLSDLLAGSQVALSAVSLQMLLRMDFPTIFRTANIKYGR